MITATAAPPIATANADAAPAQSTRRRRGRITAPPAAPPIATANADAARAERSRLRRRPMATIARNTAAAARAMYATRMTRPSVALRAGKSPRRRVATVEDRTRLPLARDLSAAPTRADQQRGRRAAR